jgi:hypothetical protein
MTHINFLENNRRTGQKNSPAGCERMLFLELKTAMTSDGDGAPAAS